MLLCTPAAPFARPDFPTNMAPPTSQNAGARHDHREMHHTSLCVDDVIFEEGSTGRELFVVLDGQVDIAKVNGSRQDRDRDARQRRVLRQMAVIDGSVPLGDGDRGHAEHPRDADQSRPLRLSGQPATRRLRLMIMDAPQQALAGVERRHLQNRGQLMSDRRPSPFKTLLDNDVCTLIEAAEGRLPDPLQEPCGETPI